MEFLTPFDVGKQPTNAQAIDFAFSGQSTGVNIQAITVYTYSKNFIIEPNIKTTNITKRLLIDKSTGRAAQLCNSNEPEECKKKNFSAFLGLVHILDKAFLFLVEDVNLVCSIDDKDIFQVASLSFIPFENENEMFLNNPKGRDIRTEVSNHIQNLRKLFSSGYYFSYNYDLTLSKIKMANSQPSDEKFLWNGYMFKSFLSHNIDRKWLVPLIQGFIGHFTVYLNGKKLDLYLITRRGCKRGGTRYIARGIDDDGNVANFCETEQIVYYNKYCCSHVQIRGSVPAFWQQRGYTAQAKITRNYELTHPAFLKHFDDLTKDYSRILCVNLMAKGKSQEQMITEAYETLVRTNNLPNLRYEYFDFHHACRGQKFEKVNPLVKKLQLMSENFRFYVEDLRTNSVLMTQKGVIRTNCLDCLDRTNFFMAKAAAVIFQFQMQLMGVDLQQVFGGQDIIHQLDNNNPKANHPFILNLKNIWADNGDAISFHYTGTGSTHTNITRTGKRDFAGSIDHGMKSLKRFYIQNFEDNIKQEAIDLILGQHTETTNAFQESIEKELKIRERDFASFEELSVLVSTWNMTGFEPPETYDLTSHILNMDGNPKADIVVIGLQEVIGSRGMDKVINSWTMLIATNLARLGGTVKYVLIKYKEVGSSLLLIFAQEKFKDRINKVEADTTKIGFMGSKGGVIIKFSIDDTSFGFINCQLEGGSKSFNSRMMNINEIHNKAFQVEDVGKKKELKIETLDYKFLFGELNFRINMNDSDIRQYLEGYDTCIKSKKKSQADDILKFIFSNDELSTAKNLCDPLSKYQEAPINFMPTSKYDFQSTTYKSSISPSWSDRIMIWANEGYIVKQYFYNRRDNMNSENRPVSAYYLLEVKKVNQKKRDEIMKQLLEEEKAFIEEEVEDKVSLDIFKKENHFATSSSDK